MRLTAIQATVFFVRAGDTLRQVVAIGVENPGQDQTATLLVRGEDIDDETALGVIPAGASEHEITIPDLRSPATVRFELWSQGQPHSAEEVQWRPQRHWEVHLIHYIHHDLGYTDLPSNVLAEYDEHLDQVLAYCAETERWPEADARFRFQCEQAWSLLDFIEHRPAAVRERLLHYIHNGQIEVTALFGNITLELCGHEELIRLLYPAFALKRIAGVHITSAEHNDIPGFAWGLASVLAGAGVRYFSPGIPLWYFGFGERRVHPLWDVEQALPLEMPAACWWEGPDGARVLLWSDLHGQEWQPYDLDQARHELPAILREFEEAGYPYDMTSFTLRGGHRDNAPPTLRYAHLARAWNRRWAYPRLINTTNTPFLREFERRWGHTLKTLRGDVPGTDYAVAATCTPKETALNRTTHDNLLSAEKLATLAAAHGGYDYPQQRLADAFRALFYYDEHCWGLAHVGGPAMDAHWSDKSTFAYKAAALAHDVALKAANKLVDQIAYPAEGWYLTIFNPLAHPRRDLVRVPLRSWSPAGSPMFWQPADAERPWPQLRSGRALGRRIVEPPLALFEQPFEVVDVATGERIPYQLSRLTDPQAAANWAAERVALTAVDERHAYELVLLIDELPALGYRSVQVRPCAAWPDFAATNLASETRLENRFFQLIVDPARGVITSIVDRATGAELVDSAAGHGFAQLIVRDCATSCEAPAHMSGATVVEDGPLFTTWRLKGEAPCCPRLTVEVTLYHAIKRIDLNARLLRDSTPLHELYLAFPFLAQQPSFHFEATNAVIEPAVDQWPGSNTDYYAVQHWVHVGNDSGGIIWTPLDAPMAEFGGLWPGYVSGAHHGVTGPGYGHAFLRPGDLVHGHIYSLISYNNFNTNFLNVSPGEVVLRYAFTTHQGDWRADAVRHFGWDAANPPLGVWMQGPQLGALPSATSFCAIDAPNVLLLACKHAEDGHGIIVRVQETSGQATTARLHFPHWQLDRAVVTNLVEEDQRELDHQEQSVAISLQPFATFTLRVFMRVSIHKNSAGPA